MNSMGGHGAPSQASACTTPPQSWGGPAICALCLRRGIASPFLFYTALHTHMHTACRSWVELKIFKVEEILPLCLSVCFPRLSPSSRKKALPLLSLTLYEISTFPSFLFISSITLAHNERLCFPGSCRLTCRNCSHSSLSLPRLFGKKDQTPP